MKSLEKDLERMKYKLDEVAATFLEKTSSS